MSVESYIGWRYLKAKRKQTFISLITLISLAGIALGVTALIVVLAVMSGFGTDLKNKILGVNSHLVILKAGQPMQDYRRLMPLVEKFDQVVSVEPFIFSQVMLNGLGGVTGAVLRGLDPELAKKTSHLAKSIIKGRLASLEAKSPESGKPDAVMLVGIELARQLGLQVGDQ
ncbi:MAG: ABC transporter permease, partial [Pseudomonadota bacterium]